MLRRYTLTIGIPAHNEEANIARLLFMLLAQSRAQYSLEKIVVVTDGCTDETAREVERVIRVNPLVHLKNDGKRYGKAARLNWMYQTNESDILVTLDADVLPADDYFLDELVDKLVSNESIAVVAGNSQPFPPQTFTERIIVAHKQLWYYVRKDLRKGENLYNSSGQSYAFRKDFLRTLELPIHTAADQQLLYLAVRKTEAHFAFAERAVIMFRVPSTFAEWRSAKTRPDADPKLLRDETKNYRITWGMRLNAFWKTFKKMPLFACLAMLLYVVEDLALWQALSRDIVNPEFWSALTSTKHLPPIRKR